MLPVHHDIGAPSVGSFAADESTIHSRIDEHASVVKHNVVVRFFQRPNCATAPHLHRASTVFESTNSDATRRSPVVLVALGVGLAFMVAPMIIRVGHWLSR
ncbi:MAG: hypothetical protein JNK05_00005 [Myxococcales bacterium]|nr:hypothetical protein [Myxococcales bacterium]